MSLGNVLWIIGVAVAASSDDPLVAAATDGASVWITSDAGLRWRRVGPFDRRVEEESDPDDDVDGASRVGAEVVDGRFGAPGDLDDRAHSIRAVAILADDLVVATEDGLFAVGIAAGGPRPRSRELVDTLAVSDATLFATAGTRLMRSDDRGRTFVDVMTIPTGEATSLAVAGGRALVATPVDVLLVDLESRKARRLGCGAAAVAASEDGSLWRALPFEVQRSTDGGEVWTHVSSIGGRAIAVSPSDVWLASGGRVGRLDELARAPQLRVASEWPARLREAALRSRAWGRPFPAPRLVARAVWIDRSPGAVGPERETRFDVLLQWDLDGRSP